MTSTPRPLSETLRAALGSRYELGAEVGRGGMGVVFLAHDRTLHRDVAVKVVHPQLATHPAIADRFLAEARLVARLRHPNIVTVHDAGTASGLLYFVMDYVPGESLRDRLTRDGRLPAAEAQRILDDLCAALDEAARGGVVHRDLKPENVLLEQGTGRAMLVDFGVARAIAADGRPEITGQGMAIGTPAYMSPEQAAGAAEVDHRSDLYALGVVAYEMLSGTPPFTGPPRVVVSHHLSTRPPALRSRVECPAALAQAIMRALEKDPAHRWQSGAAFREAAAGRSRGGRARRRGPLVAAALAGVAVLVAAGALANGREPGPPPGVNPRHSILVLPFENLRDDADLAWLREGSVSLLGTKLSFWSELTVVDHARVHDLLAARGVDEADRFGIARARQLARDAGVWTVVLGEFEQSGDSLALTARMFDVASGQRVDQARVAGGSADQVFTIFDSLANALLDLAGAPGGISADLASATTGSLEAYRAYLRGLDLLLGWNLEPAEREFRAAVQADSGFSLAWYRLALTRGWMVGANDVASREAMARASRLSANLPLRDRLLINGYRLFLQGDMATSRGHYEELIRRDSTAADAWYGLADALFHDDAMPLDARFTRSYAAFQRSLELEPDFALAFDHMAFMLGMASIRGTSVVLLPGDSFALAQGLAPARLDAALARAGAASVALARRWTMTQPDGLRAHATLVDVLLQAGDVAGARAEVDRFAATAPAHPGFALERGRAAFVGGQADSALRQLTPTVDSASPEDFDAWVSGMDAAIDLEAAANVFAYRGDLARAARAIELSDRVRARFLEATSFDAPAPDPYRGHRRLLTLSHLYAASGGPTATLRRLWDTAAELARSGSAAERAHVARMGAPAALGLFRVGAADTTALMELRALAGDEFTREVRALMAIASGDTTAGRRLLEAPAEPGGPQGGMDGPTAASLLGDYRTPLEASARLSLGDFRGTLRVLEGFEAGRLHTAKFDPRWAMLGQVRLMRGMAYEGLGRRAEAERSYREVMEQWQGADPAVEPYLSAAAEGLARVQAAENG